MRIRASRVAFGGLLLIGFLVSWQMSSRAESASGSAAVQDAPTGTIAFFDLTSCPAGWAVASDAAGQLIVAVTAAAAVGQTNGEPPLADKEDRKHDHCYLTQVELHDKSISALSAPGNGQGAAKGEYPVAGVFDEATSNLPFTQMLICERQ